MSSSRSMSSSSSSSSSSSMSMSTIRRRRRTQGACSSLLATLGWRVLAAVIRHLQVVVFATDGAAVQLRLVQ